MEQRHLCLCQCCQGGTSVPGQEHDSSVSYRPERGDRQEQITLISGGEKEGWEIKSMKKRERREVSNRAVISPHQ